MSRPIHEIAQDIRDAVTTIGTTIFEAGQAMGAPPPPGGAQPKVEVKLPDGRVVEIGALADEILAQTKPL